MRHMILLVGMISENKPIFNIIAAYTKDGRVLGDDSPSGMPWGLTLKKDMRNFRRLTAGNTLAVGPNTLPHVEDLHDPDGLKLKRNVVVVASDDSRLPKTDCPVVPTLYEAMLMIHSDPLRFGDMYVAGGARTYGEAMSLLRSELSLHIGTCAYLYATEIDGQFTGNAFMPELDANHWHELSREPQMPDTPGGPSYDFVRYRFN